LGLPDEQPIEAKMVSKSIEQAQKKIEGLHFDSRKHVLEFDDVLNHQRNVIYKRRRRYLAGTEESKDVDLKQEILDLVKDEIGGIVSVSFNSVDEAGNVNKDWDNLFKQLNVMIPVTPELQKQAKAEAENAADQEFAVTDVFYKAAEQMWEQKEKEMGKE